MADRRKELGLAWCNKLWQRQNVSWDWHDNQLQHREEEGKLGLAWTGYGRDRRKGS